MIRRSARIGADIGERRRNSNGAVYELFREINRERGTALLIVTHDRGVAEMTDRILEMRDGELIQDVRNDYAS
ncbi:MAG TPA: hypothetical protein VLA29_00305 [Acidimicrobiia bacterium]|nr:hypothetical protein [Acidimicrobiia bacterium]